MADQRQSTANTSEDKNQARRERDRARRNSLTTEQRDEINARRRAASRRDNQQRHEHDRARRLSLTHEQKEDINARRRKIPRCNITEDKRPSVQAQRRENAAAKRNTACPESIAMPCPNAAILQTINLASSTHISPVREGREGAPDFTIRTNSKTIIFTPFIYVINKY